MGKKYCRPVTLEEKMCLVRVDPATKQQCAVQGIIEGTGTFDLEKWEQAVRAASLANVATHVTLKKKAFKYYWVESDVLPTVRVVSDSQWDGLSSKGIEYLPDRLCPVNGPICEVILVEGKGTKQRVIINALHGAMDGMSTVLWGCDVFRFLRGVPMIGSNSTLTNCEAVKGVKATKSATEEIDFVSLFEKKKPSKTGTGGIWVRKLIPQTISKVIPKICRVVAEETWKHKDGRIRFFVPVDLRRRFNLSAVSNLTGSIFLEISKEQTIRDINLDLINQLRNHSYCHIPWIVKKMAPYVPLGVINKKSVAIDGKSASSGRYMYSGVVTHLGRLTKHDMDADLFKGDSWFSITSMNGPGSPCIAVTISEVVTGDQRHCNLIVEAPEIHADYSDIESIANEIVAVL